MRWVLNTVVSTQTLYSLSISCGFGHLCFPERRVKVGLVQGRIRRTGKHSLQGKNEKIQLLGLL